MSSSETTLDRTLPDDETRRLGIADLLFSMGDAGTWRVSMGLLLLRGFAGLSLALTHGLHKLPPSAGFVEGVSHMGFPAPTFFAWCSVLAEFAGGLLLALGLLTRPAALFIAFNMAVAAFIHHAPDTYSTRERAILYLCIALTFLITGPGRLSLDALVRSARSKLGR